MADQKHVGEEIPNEEGILVAELTSGTVPSEKGAKVPPPQTFNVASFTCGSCGLVSFF